MPVVSKSNKELQNKEFSRSQFYVFKEFSEVIGMTIDEQKFQEFKLKHLPDNMNAPIFFNISDFKLIHPKDSDLKLQDEVSIPEYLKHPLARRDDTRDPIVMYPREQVIV